MTTYERLKPRLAKSAFRSKFKLTYADRIYVAEKGMSVIAAQARGIIEERLAPALPANDGKQTPMRGHVVFVAQHATGCCCRTCLAKWHNISQGHALTEEEIQSVVEVICAWTKEQLGNIDMLPHTPDLFS